MDFLQGVLINILIIGAIEIIFSPDIEKCNCDEGIWYFKFKIIFTNFARKFRIWPIRRKT